MYTCIVIPTPTSPLFAHRLTSSHSFYRFILSIWNWNFPLLCCALSRKFPGPYTSHSPKCVPSHLHGHASRERPWDPWEAPLNPKLKGTAPLLPWISSALPLPLQPRTCLSLRCVLLYHFTCTWPGSNHNPRVLNVFTGTILLPHRIVLRGLNELSVEEWGTAPGPLAGWNEKSSHLAKH